MTREEKAIVAMLDYVRRDGATKHQVVAAMTRDGFTAKEISKAAEAMGAGS